MKRTPLPPRKAPLARSPRAEKPKPRTRVKKENRARKARRFVEQFDSPEFVRFVQNCACEVCGCRPSVCAHARSRGAGGLACDVLPLCESCHVLQHQLGVVTFSNLYGLSLRDAAAQTWAAWQELQEAA